MTNDDMSHAALELWKYTEGPLHVLWKRPELSPRDRSIITIAALIARNHTIELPYHINLALDNGIHPREVSEIITHLAFYSGRENALAAIVIAQNVFNSHHTTKGKTIEPVMHLAIDETAEAKRAENVKQRFGNVAPGLLQFTTDILFRDLWLRSDLTTRDRSLVTVSALIAGGHVAQMPFHVNKAMDSGLTRTQLGEVITHLAFYVGWPNAFSGMSAVKEILEQRHH